MWSFTVWCCCFWYRIFVTLLQTRAQSFLFFFWTVSRATSGKTKSQNTLGMRLATGFLGCAIELEFVDIKNSHSYNDKTDLRVERLLSSSGKGRGSTTVFFCCCSCLVFFFQLISPILSPYILSTSFIAMSSLWWRVFLTPMHRCLLMFMLYIFTI